MVLKLSVDVHSSIEEILICCLCVHVIMMLPWQRHNYMQVYPQIVFFVYKAVQFVHFYISLTFLK